MAVDVDFGDELDLDLLPEDIVVQDPDEFLANNAFRIVYQSNNFFLPQIRHMIESGEAINLRPEYQRRLRWTNGQKSRLIESLLLNIPIPPVFFYESDAARYEVMDGQQRMNAIREFFAGDYRLSGLKVLAPLNGLTYSKCPPRVKRTLDRASISAIVLLMESEREKPDKKGFSVTDIRRLVFDRLNTGGMKLNPQEIRSSQNPGALNDAIIKLSRGDAFTHAFGIPPYTENDIHEFYENPRRQKNSLYSSMRDCELVLRFFALREDENIKGSMKVMLDRAMAVSRSIEQAAQASDDYNSVFQFLYQLFDKAPFQITAPGEEKTKVSVPLYDALMVAAWNLREDLGDISADKDGVQQRLVAALADEGQYEVIVGRGNTADAVRARITLLQKNLEADYFTMTTAFSVIKDDFVEELGSIGALIDAFDNTGARAKTRVASVNSSVLLLAATFEEFIREMAKQYARHIVERAENVQQIPDRLTETAWKRTLEGLARARLKVNGSSVLETVSRSSRAKFEAVCGFIAGDLNQDVFEELIHNESNMRVGEMNGVFKVTGLTKVCEKICARDEVQHFFSETDQGKAYGQFQVYSDEFFERRNAIAHSLNAVSSVGANQIRTDIAFFEALGQSLCSLLDELTAE